METREKKGRTNSVFAFYIDWNDGESVDISNNASKKEVDNFEHILDSVPEELILSRKSNAEIIKHVRRNSVIKRRERRQILKINTEVRAVCSVPLTPINYRPVIIAKHSENAPIHEASTEELSIMKSHPKFRKISMTNELMSFAEAFKWEEQQNQIRQEKLKSVKAEATSILRNQINKNMKAGVKDYEDLNDSTLSIGQRVVVGLDWKSTIKDRGATGKIGIVVKGSDANGNGLVGVKWFGGRIGYYRWGRDGKYEVAPLESKLGHASLLAIVLRDIRKKAFLHSTLKPSFIHLKKKAVGWSGVSSPIPTNLEQSRSVLRSRRQSTGDIIPNTSPQQQLLQPNLPSVKGPTPVFNNNKISQKSSTPTRTQSTGQIQNLISNNQSHDRATTSASQSKSKRQETAMQSMTRGVPSGPVNLDQMKGKSTTKIPLLSPSATTTTSSTSTPLATAPATVEFRKARISAALDRLVNQKSCPTRTVETTDSSVQQRPSAQRRGSTGAITSKTAVTISSQDLFTKSLRSSEIALPSAQPIKQQSSISLAFCQPITTKTNTNINANTNTTINTNTTSTTSIPIFTRQIPSRRRRSIEPCNCCTSTSTTSVPVGTSKVSRCERVADVSLEQQKQHHHQQQQQQPKAVATQQTKRISQIPNKTSPTKPITNPVTNHDIFLQSLRSTYLPSQQPITVSSIVPTVSMPSISSSSTVSTDTQQRSSSKHTNLDGKKANSNNIQNIKPNSGIGAAATAAGNVTIIKVNSPISEKMKIITRAKTEKSSFEDRTDTISPNTTTASPAKSPTLTPEHSVEQTTITTLVVPKIENIGYFSNKKLEIKHPNNTTTTAITSTIQDNAQLSHLNMELTSTTSTSTGVMTSNSSLKSTLTPQITSQISLQDRIEETIPITDLGDTLEQENERTMMSTIPTDVTGYDTQEVVDVQQKEECSNRQTNKQKNVHKITEIDMKISTSDDSAPKPQKLHRASTTFFIIDNKEVEEEIFTPMISSDSNDLLLENVVRPNAENGSSPSPSSVVDTFVSEDDGYIEDDEDRKQQQQTNVYVEVDMDEDSSTDVDTPRKSDIILRNKQKSDKQSNRRRTGSIIRTNESFSFDIIGQSYNLGNGEHLKKDEEVEGITSNTSDNRTVTWAVDVEKKRSRDASHELISLDRSIYGNSPTSNTTSGPQNKAPSVVSDVTNALIVNENDILEGNMNEAANIVFDMPGSPRPKPGHVRKLSDLFNKGLNKSDGPRPAYSYKQTKELISESSQVWEKIDAFENIIQSSSSVVPISLSRDNSVVALSVDQRTKRQSLSFNATKSMKLRETSLSSITAMPNTLVQKPLRFNSSEHKAVSTLGFICDICEPAYIKKSPSFTRWMTKQSQRNESQLAYCIGCKLPNQ